MFFFLYTNFPFSVAVVVVVVELTLELCLLPNAHIVRLVAKLYVGISCWPAHTAIEMAYECTHSAASSNGELVVVLLFAEMPWSSGCSQSGFCVHSIVVGKPNKQ